MDFVERVIGWRQRPAAAWFFAIVGVLAAFLIRAVLPTKLLFATFFPAVMFAALVAGPVAGTVAALLSTLIAWYVFKAPAFTFAISAPSDLVDFATFLATSGILILLSEKLARSLERLARTRDQNQVLVRESVHRQKNLLALVTAIVRLSGREAKSMRDFEEQALSRIQAFAGSLAVDADSQDFHHLVRTQVEVFSNGADLFMDGPRLTLTDVQSTYVALALHELVSNCVKHGAWRNGLGVVTIRTSNDNGTVTIRWREQSTLPIEAPDGSGFGRQLLDRIVPAALEGTAAATFEPHGLTWTLTLPAVDTPEQSDEATGQRDDKAAA
ncbi:MAG: DUF4118 domain-containing protein [Hyphomicrobiales bacterium]